MLTPAQPVCSNIICAACGVITSPFPITGMDFTAATTLLAAWRAGPAGQLGNAHCIVGAVDRLGGQPVSLVLSTVDQALREAEARGPFSMQVCSARESADSAAVWAGRLGILRALDEGRVRLAEFPVLDAQGQVLHLECPLRLRRVAWALNQSLL